MTNIRHSYDDLIRILNIEIERKIAAEDLNPDKLDRNFLYNSINNLSRELWDKIFKLYTIINLHISYIHIKSNNNITEANYYVMVDLYYKEFTINLRFESNSVYFFIVSPLDMVCKEKLQSVMIIQKPYEQPEQIEQFLLHEIPMQIEFEQL